MLTIGLATFAFSTTLGWSYYGERCVEYLKGKRWMLIYRMLYIVSIFLGSVISLGLVWNIADCMNALMAIPNLISCSVSAASSFTKPASISGATSLTGR